MSIEQLEAEADNTQSALDALKEEQFQLPKRLQEAAKVGDGAKLLELRRRLDELPTLISAATFTALTAEIAVLEAYGEQGAPIVAAHRVEVAEAQAKVKAAEAALVVVMRKANGFDGRQRMNRARLSELRRKVEDMAGELGQKPGKVVRSMIHAS